MQVDDINQRIEAFLDDLSGPLGQRPVERVLRNHLGLFQALRETGASWRQIAALLAKRGLRRKDGSPVPPEQWAAMISRQMKDGAEKPSKISYPSSAKSVIPQFIPQFPDQEKSQQNTHASIRNRMKAASKARSD